MFSDNLVLVTDDAKDLRIMNAFLNGGLSANVTKSKNIVWSGGMEQCTV